MTRKSPLFGGRAGQGGIARAGLVGMYLPALDPDAFNLLAWSEDFSVSLWQTENVTRTTSRITETAVDARHRIFQAVTVSGSTQYTFSVELKAGTRTWAFLRWYESSGYRIWFDLQNGVIGTVDSGVTGAISSVGDGWYRVSLIRTTGASPSGVNIGICTATADGVETFLGETDKYIDVRKAQLNVGSLQPYVKTTDKQLYLDRSGLNLDGQLGSTSNTDTNDPTWMGDGLYYTTDDYVNLDAAGPVYGSGYTVLMVVKGAAQNGKCVYSDGAAVGNPFLVLGSSGVDYAKLRVLVRDNAGAYSLNATSTLTAFDSNWHLVGFRDNNGSYTFFVDGNKESGSYTPGTLTLDKVTVGALGRASYADFFTGGLTGPLRWKRAITDAQYNAIRNTLRLWLAAAPTPVVLP